jgi:type IV pilus assembly protein PilW
MLNVTTARPYPAARQTGFSIVELMIAIAVFTIVMGAVYGLLEVGRQGRTNTLQRTEAVQNARIAVNYIGRDALNAGVTYPNAGCLMPDDGLNKVGLSTAADTDPDFDVLTPVFGSNNVNMINGALTDDVTFAFADDGFNGGNGLTIDQINVTGTTAQMRVRAPANNSPVTIGDIYMVTGINGYALVTVTSLIGADEFQIAEGDPLNLNAVTTATPSALRAILGLAPGCGTCAANASLVRLRWVSYRLTGDGNPSGTLIRRVWGGRDSGGNAVAGSDQPLAHGVDNFQVSYTLRDGSVIEDPTAIQMQLIRQVRVSIDVSSPELDPRTNQPYRQSLFSVWSTRNLEYEKQ